MVTTHKKHYGGYTKDRQVQSISLQNITKSQRKTARKKTKELQNSLEIIDKMTTTIVSSYLSIIPLNINGLNSSKDVEWMVLKEKGSPKSMLPTRDSLQLQGHTKGESKGRRKIPCRWEIKASGGSCTSTRENRLKAKW